MARRWQWALFAYLALLALSHLVRWWRSPPPSGPAVPAVEMPAFAGARAQAGERVRMAYRQWPPASRGEGPVLLLVHGSPGDGAQLAGLAPLLAERFRVVVPDLPGFGRSSREVPDYSILAHAGYCLELLDALGVREAHLVGFSMGGGVVLEMARLAPGRVRSITLLSAIGAQELELFGQYRLNHAVHGLQLAALRLLHEGVPHFGLLDGSMLDVAYARNFYDSDQRPLRAVLEGYGGPMLILHGRRDVLVPFEAALEHARIVPQSELVTFDANHFLVFTRPERLAGPIAGFVERVEAGAATLRSGAAAERVAAAREGEPIRLGKLAGLALAVSMLLIALATLASEDLTCIAVGLLVAQGRIGFVPGAAACAAGIFFGDLLLYLAGRWLGRPWVERAPLRWWVSAEALARSTRWFERRGALVIFLSRFVPGTRLPTYTAAGVLRMGFWWFTACLLLPVAIWTPLLVALSEALGRRMLVLFETFSRFALLGVVLSLLAVWIVLGLGRRLLTHRGRRRLVGGWRRLARWEFWPPWAFYPPVVAYVLWLGLRFRSPTLFTVSNPAIPASGFIGESKAAILEGLEPSAVARFRRLPHRLSLAERLEAVRAFRAELGLGWPVVLKPDAGQRGAGVTVARSEDEVEAFLRRTPRAALVQEHVGGVELGLFYARLPGAARGELFSITDKRFPEVVGDGRRSLERLILDDPRAVALAEVYFQAQAGHLERVPRPGEKVRLVELGTHCRGAIFLDGERYRTPALEAAVEAIARPFEGFYFGRFDVRTPTYEAVMEGRDLRVIELNGVTSEATHLYDPKHSLFDAYRILFDQWLRAFEIAERNRRCGHRPVPARQLLRALLDYRRRAR